MPGAFRRSSSSDITMGPQPPPVAPRTGAAKVKVQTWQSAQKIAEPPSDERGNYGHHVRCGSLDSVDSNSGSSVSSSSSGSHSRQLSNDGEFLPTRTLGKTPTVPSSHNPLQFVKVQSPLYKKADHQIKIAKEVKVTKEALKESEEEWQSNLDNWKSRRRKASEKVIQRAEEMRQIEAEEQFRQLKEQQRKIKTFSEMVEKRSTKRSYNLDLYIGQGDDSGVGGTPEPDEQDSVLDSQHSNIRSDISEGMTSESDSIDSDAHISEKAREPPKVPKKPHSWLARKDSNDSITQRTSSPKDLLPRYLTVNDHANSENVSSAEPSDIEGHVADIETVSSEDDAVFCGPIRNTDSGLESLCDNHHRPNDITDSASDLSQDSSSGMDKVPRDIEPEVLTDRVWRRRQLSRERSIQEDDDTEVDSEKMRIIIVANHGQDAKGFGFSIGGGKNHGSEAFVDSIVPGGPADFAGLKTGDKVLTINGEATSKYSHTSLVFSVKQASYAGQLDLLVNRTAELGISAKEEKQKFGKRGASFAEKIALFSGSTQNNQPNAHSNLPSTQSSSKSGKISKEEQEEAVRRESLVLRRRSAFERSLVDRECETNRRSSCVSPESTMKTIKEEWRHSGDFSKQLDKSNDSVSKKPPPPIPAKPKPKSKTPQALLHHNMSHTISDYDSCSSEEIAEQNGRKEISPQNISNGAETENYTTTYFHEFSGNPENQFPDVFESSHEGTENQCSHTTEQSPIESSYLALENDAVSVDDMNSFDSGSCDEIAALEQRSIERTSPLFSEARTIDHDDVKDMLFSTVDNVNNEKNCVSESFPAAGFVQDVEPTENLESHDNSRDISDTNLESVEAAVESGTTFRSAVFLDNSPQNHVSMVEIVPCERSSLNDVEDEADDVSFERGEGSGDDECYRHAADSPPDFESNSPEDVIIENDVSVISREHFLQINVHPLSLPLEKIDEDEPGSGSSSSNTPDTETVIDTFPSNVSPLPADDTSDVPPLPETRQHYEFIEKATEFQPSQAADVFEATSEEEYRYQASQPHPSANHMMFMDRHPTARYEIYLSNEDLDDSEERTDQLSPLDVIDQIEMKLMQQLEQQALEDLTDDSNGQLQEEVNRELLYLSDDADLINDLDAPRNAVPPSEPPPPPPPEPERLDSRVNPFQRVNSTKRIKKEIWRRRSDFLGLESPEGLVVDDLPPPPPGLEELLKSEMEMQREQRLFIEKRLSLVDSECTSATSTLNSASELSSAFSPSKEYTSEYMLEVLDAEVFDAVAADEPQDEEWKVSDECQIPVSDTNLHETNLRNIERDCGKQAESPQHKPKNHIQSLGAAPRAKIMDSNKWITQAEKHVPLTKRATVDPLFREGSYNQNFWLSQEAGHRSSMGREHSPVDRRYSLPPAYGSRHPDVTVRTWSDRESEYQLQPRPKSGVWPGSPSSIAQQYPSYSYPNYLPTQNPSWTGTTASCVQEEKASLEVSHQCSCCGKALTEGSAMGIDALQLYFHIECFRCCMCQLQLGNGSCGTDVQVKDSQLYCPKCFAID